MVAVYAQHNRALWQIFTCPSKLLRASCTGFHIFSCSCTSVGPPNATACEISPSAWIACTSMDACNYAMASSLYLEIFFGRVIAAKRSDVPEPCVDTSRDVYSHLGSISSNHMTSSCACRCASTWRTPQKALEKVFTDEKGRNVASRIPSRSAQPSNHPLPRDLHARPVSSTSTRATASAIVSSTTRLPIDLRTAAGSLRAASWTTAGRSRPSRFRN